MKIVLKLGGSILTEKEDDKDFPKNLQEAVEKAEDKIRLQNIVKITAQLQTFLQANSVQLVLITGAGCYGHPQVKAGLPAGDIHQIVRCLNLYVGTVLACHGIGRKTSSPFYFAKCLDSDTTGGLSYDISELWRVMKQNLDQGIIACTHGDVVQMVEGKKGRLDDYEVISGDDLATDIAEYWSADKVIMVSDISGVYTSDPKDHADAKKLDKIIADEKIKDDIQFREKMENEYGVRFEEAKDVTGGLFKKFRKLYDMTHEFGIISQIISISDLESALLGADVGTMIIKPSG